MEWEPNPGGRLPLHPGYGLEGINVYTSFSVKNFRCIADMTIEKMARVNLVAGRNNVGKTALLEALWLHSGPNLPELGDRLARFRGIANPDPKRPFADLFYDFDLSREILLSAGGDWKGNHRILKVESQPLDHTAMTAQTAKESSLPPRGSQEPDVTAVSSSKIVFEYTDEAGNPYTSSGYWARSEIPSVAMGPNSQMVGGSFGLVSHVAKMPPHPTSVFMSARNQTNPGEDVKRFGEVELEGHIDSITDCLKIIDERIKELKSLSIQTPMIYADMGLNRLVPMGFLGDGICRYLSMTLAFYESRNGLILIDEVENGLHHSVLKGVWQNIDYLSQKFNVQVFATTHSRECLVAARDAFAADEIAKDAALYHRLERQDDRIIATTYPFDDFDFTLDYGAEIR